MRLQYLKTESLRSFFDQVRKTREAQKNHFKIRSDDTLEKAIRNEKILDQMTTDIEIVEGDN